MGRGINQMTPELEADFLRELAGKGEKKGERGQEWKKGQVLQ